MFRLVASGKADAVIHGLASGEFMLQKNHISNVVSHGEFLAKGESRLQAAEFVVRKDLPHLMSIIDKTYASIAEAEKQAIWNRWFGKNASGVKTSSVLFTDRERAWLAQNHTVQVRVVNIPPYIILSKGGEPEGISIDYLNFIAERTGVKFHYHFSGKTFPQALDGLKKHTGPDLITSMMRTPDREKSILFSTDYFRSPYVIFTHEKDKTFISDIADLYGRIIALPKGTVILEKIKKDFPDIKIVLFDNDIQAIEAVATNRADVYIGNLALASFLILDKGISGLKIAGPSPFGDHVFSMGIRNDWPALASIMDKALATMSQTERAKIRNKYIAIRYEHSKAAAVLKWVGMILSAAFVAIFLFFYWNRQLAKKVKAGTVELRENRDYLKNLTDSMPDAIFSVNMPDRKIEWANDTFKVFGYEAAECIGKKTEFLYPSRQDYLAIGEAMAHAIAEGNAVLRFDHTMRKKNGDLFPADITLSIFKVGKEVSRVTGIVRDISERRQREQRLQKYQERLKALASQLTVAEEKERRRIATDLHDHVGHSLALARMQMGGILECESEMGRTVLVKDVSNIMKQTLQEVRSLIFDLSSPSMNEIGLGAAISEWMEERMAKRHGLETKFVDKIGDDRRKTMDPNVRALLFRNVRELLTNVVKHARASKVCLCLLEENNAVKIIIEDDGIGFDASKLETKSGQNGGFGLFSIQERMTDLGGALEIKSKPGEGCRMVLVVPLEGK
jgi:PAS domain S-box-containing protein